ncbi:barstar family protein [Streptomyces syringium]|uniref:barstar family protein n=1 Tax=Streptomyces syringium TaxID=76729 RepID=UPI0037D240DE
MHRAIAAALHFPDYYGHNLDALNDCLGDVACFGPYDDEPERTGLALSFANYDRFAVACPKLPRSSSASSLTRLAERPCSSAA